MRPVKFPPMADFADFLRTTAQMDAGGSPIFDPGSYDESRRDPWVPFESPRRSSHADVDAAERQLGLQLPAGYRTFVTTVGPGGWCEALISPPEGLYQFDEELGRMQGWVAMGFNVDGAGNYIAFNPKDGWIYYCCHDPFGYAVAGRTFEDFLQKLTQYALTNNLQGLRKFYDSLRPFTEVTPPAVPAAKARGTAGKPWWKFW